MDVSVGGCVEVEDGNVYGCTDMDACNYDSDATADDGSCDYGTMCWDGSYVCDASDCPDQPSGSVEVMFSTITDVAGFQFNVDGVTVTGAGGGAATDAGFTISTSATTVIGFSLTGATIPSGDGVLVVLEVEGNTDDACLSNLVLSDNSGAAIDAAVEGCTSIVEANDCPEGYDECGVCGGNNSSCEDCAGVPNGDAVEDECGVCDGPGADVMCWDGSYVCDLSLIHI